MLSERHGQETWHGSLTGEPVVVGAALCDRFWLYDETGGMEPALFYPLPSFVEYTFGIRLRHRVAVNLNG